MTDFVAVKKALPFILPRGVAGDPGGTMVTFREGAGTYAFSTDGGDSWTTATNPLSGCDSLHWNGSYFLAVYQDTCAKSTTGLGGSWTTGTFPTNPTRSWTPALAWSSSLSLWLCSLGQDGANSAVVATSSDGISWSNNTVVAGTDQVVLDVCWDAPNTRFVVLLTDDAGASDRKIYTSSSGTGSWTLRATLSSASYAPRLLLAAGSNLLAYPDSSAHAPLVSSDGGVTWTLGTGPGRGCGAHVAGHIVYSSQPFSGAQNYYKSTDGLAYSIITISGITAGTDYMGESRSYHGDGSTYGMTTQNDGYLYIITGDLPATAFWTDNALTTEVFA